MTVGAAVLGVTLLGTAACGSGTPGQGRTEGGSTGSTESTGSGGGPVTVEIWQNQFQPNDNAWFEGAVKAFNDAHDDVQIKLVVVPGDAWEQKMKAAQAAGKTPDGYTRNYSAIQPAARGGELGSLTEYFDASAWSDLDKRFLDAVTVDGKQYAYPIYYEPSSLLFYRKSMWTAAGLDVANPPKSWDDLIKDAEALKAANKDVVPFQTAQNATELAWTTWGMQINAAGHWPISDDWSKSLVGDGSYQPLFDTYKKLMDDGLLAKQALSAYGDLQPLAEGKLAMAASGSWAINQLLDQFPDAVDDIAIAPLPSLDGDLTKTTGTLGGWAFVMDAKSQHPKETAEAISYMTAEDPAIPLDYFVKTNFTKMSPRTSVAEEIAKKDTSVDPWYQTIIDVSKYQVLEPTYDWSVSIAMGTALEKVMQGGDVTAAMGEADAAVTKAITDLNLPAQLKK
jgi:multiple sugar transport system substrate-binding protein